MKTPTEENSNFIETLQQCIKDCEHIIKTQSQLPSRERCVELSKLCISACNDSLHACESVGHGIGTMLQNCVDACKACAEECKRLAYATDLKQTFQIVKTDKSTLKTSYNRESARLN